jgi:hypothetical protein
MKPLQVFPLNQPAAGAKAHFSGAHHAEKARGEDGNLYVVKQYGIGNRSPLEVNEAIAKEVVASHIMVDEFKLPGIPYQEGAVRNQEGQLEKAVICPYVPDLSTLWETSAKKIKNPNEAVAQCVVRGWLGDWDITINNSNIFIAKDGTVLAGDFGQSFNRGISTREILVPSIKKIPKANLTIMGKYAEPSNVRPVVEKIKELSDEEIHKMVQKYGEKYVEQWDSDMESKFSEILISNRNRLAEKDIFEKFYKGFHPLITPPFSVLVTAAAGNVFFPFAQLIRDTASRVLNLKQ